MRRNSAHSISLLTLAIVLFGSVQFAHAGGLLSRLLAGKKAACRPVCKLRIFQPKYQKCPPPVTFCPPSCGGSDCPKQLLMMVSDVDENGNASCVYRVFLAENCQNHTTFTVSLSCTTNEAACINGQCGPNGNQGLEGPFVVIAALPPPIPDPGSGPIPTPAPGNPGTNGVVVDTSPGSVANGLPPIPPGSARQVIGVQATPVLAGYHQFNDTLGNTKFYALYRLSFVRNGVNMEAGVGFQIDSVPVGGMMLPARFANVFNKTNRIDETDPSDPNQIVWTYVVHDKR